MLHLYWLVSLHAWAYYSDYHESCMHNPIIQPIRNLFHDSLPRFPAMFLCPRRRHFYRHMLLKNNLCAIPNGACIWHHMQKRITLMLSPIYKYWCVSQHFHQTHSIYPPCLQHTLNLSTLSATDTQKHSKKYLY